MSLGIINESTSVIQAATSGIVYISSSSVPGHIVTVIDQTGTGNPVRLSTTAGISLTGGASSIIQPFGYITLQSITPSQWTVINQYSFSDLSATSIRTLDANTIRSQRANPTVLSTTALLTSDLSCSILQSAEGEIFASTLAISPGATLVDTSGQSMVVAGSFFITPILNVGGNLSTDRASLPFSLTLSQSINPAFMAVVSTLVVGGNISYVDATATTVAATAGLYADTVSCISSIRASSNFNVGSLLSVNNSTNSLIASTIEFNGGSAYIDSETVSVPMRISSTLSTTTLDASACQVRTLTFKRFSGASLSSINLGSATIVNTYGALQTSDVGSVSTSWRLCSTTTMTAGTTRLTQLTLDTSQATPVTLTVATGDTISFDAYWNTGPGGDTVSAGTVNTSTFSALDAIVTNLQGYQVDADTLALTSFTVEDSLAFNGPVFNVPVAAIQNANGSFVTGPVNVTAGAAFSSITGISLIDSPTLSIPSLYTAAPASASSINAVASTSTGSIAVATQVILGTAAEPGPNDPSPTIQVLSDNYWVPTTTPPYQTSQGAGTYVNPFTCNNAFNTLIYFSFNNPSGEPLYLNAAIRHTNVASVNGGTALNLNGRNIFSLLNLYRDPLITQTFTDIPLASYPILGPNPITGDTTTPWMIWEVQAGGTTSDQLSFWISNRTSAQDQAAASVFNPNLGIYINEGTMVWPSTLFDITVQNRFNDIQTRSLLYTGSLQNVSDRSLKTEIETADVARCASTIQGVPLRRYKYIAEYERTFHVKDRRRLGVLSTELAAAFPKSIRPDTLLDQPIDTVNTDQLKFAHLGATKYLMGEIAILRARIACLHPPPPQQPLKPHPHPYRKRSMT